MKTADLDYDLPAERIAQEPSAPRDAARLLVLDRATGWRRETRFGALGEHLHAGDLLVLNDTRVMPARLLARKPGGGAVEILLVEREDGGEESWRAMLSTSRGVRPGTRLAIAPGFDAVPLGEIGGGLFRVRLLGAGGGDVAIARHGRTPLPPYIHREAGDPRERLDRERYQTVYARVDGAIAAPTAGLHFTDDLLRGLAAAGIGIARLTLHVGPGTFRPVRSERLEDHRLEPEAYRLPEETARAIAACRGRRGRVVAVGTTVTRVLESRAAEDGTVRPGEGRCDLYILPGHRFLAVDALITNFHLPRTTLLALVAAFAGREAVLEAYRDALARGFRFYSYGDAMLVL
jgi:S-adenosylmethionine:tRNA ribosyltransferase-isomerase